MIFSLVSLALNILLDIQAQIHFILFQEDSWDGIEALERLKKEDARGELDVHDG
jgi:hypothetical protein